MIMSHQPFECLGFDGITAWCYLTAVTCWHMVHVRAHLTIMKVVQPDWQPEKSMSDNLV